MHKKLTEPRAGTSRAPVYYMYAHVHARNGSGTGLRTCAQLLTTCTLYITWSEQYDSACMQT